MRPRDWVRIGAAVAAIVGPFMSWASIGPISVDGVSNGRDGLIAVVAGAITLAALLLGRPKAADDATRRVSLVLAVLGGGVIAGVAIYDWHKLTEVPTGPFGLTAEPGSGLYLTLAAGVVLIVSAAMALRSQPRRTQSDEPAPSAAATTTSIDGPNVERTLPPSTP